MSDSDHVTCPHCGAPVTAEATSSWRCPFCNRRLRGRQPAAGSEGAAHPAYADLVVVAVAANLAEAGYFQSILDSHDIPAHIDQENQAAWGGFGPRQVALAAPESYAERARQLLLDEATESDHAESIRHEPSPDEAVAREAEEQAGRRVLPAVIVAGLLALTGSMVLNELSKGRGRNAADGRRAEGLAPPTWDDLFRTPQPWFQDADGDGRPERRFEFDTKTGHWRLTIDANSNGRPEAWIVYDRHRRVVRHLIDPDEDGQVEQVR